VTSLSCETVARAALSEPAKRVGAELLWRCPRHADNHPSLQVNPKKNAWLFGPCGASGTAWALAAFLAGCDPSDKAAVRTWLKEYGLSDGAKRKSYAKGRGPVVATFVHEDVDGHPVCRALRHEPGVNGRNKDYTWEHFNDDKWKSGLGNPPVIRPLYRLPQIKNEPLVFLFESHTDVARAVSMGLPATTSGGTNSWRPEYADVLSRKDVCLIPDSDGPGARFAAAVCASLYGKVNSLKVVSISPYPDFRRWADAVGTTERMLDSYRDALEFRPASGAETLNAVMEFVRRFVSLTEAQARVVALWVAHTHCLDAGDCTPYLSVTSPEKQSGKTRLLEVLELLVFEPWLTGRVSSAVLARKIDVKHPTLLLDESDTAFGSEKEYAEALRGVLNTGYRRGGVSSCCVGQGATITYRDFATFCPKAIAGIGKLPDTVADRSVPIQLKRAQRGKVERFRRREAEREASNISGKLAAWCEGSAGTLREARPEIPAQLSDRQADVSEPLLAIADLAGGDWPQEVRRAVREHCAKAQTDDDSIGVKLLADIKRVFCPCDDEGNSLEQVERIASSDLAKALGEMEDRPWAEWGKSQNPITQPQLDRQLSRYEIGPKAMRLPDGRRLKGYARESFGESWALYLPPDSPLPSFTPDSKRDSVTTRENTGENGVFQSVTEHSCHATENAVSASKNTPCHGVTVQKQGDGEKQGEKAEVEWEA
jgi:Protein of unknown function (DUF3631)